MIAEVVAKMLR